MGKRFGLFHEKGGRLAWKMLWGKERRKIAKGESSNQEGRAGILPRTIYCIVGQEEDFPQRDGKKKTCSSTEEKPQIFGILERKERGETSWNGREEREVRRKDRVAPSAWKESHVAFERGEESVILTEERKCKKAKKESLKTPKA